MNTEAFTEAYNRSRNGAAFFVRHWANRKFQFSDGVQECAEAGCHWLIDIIATEVPQAMKKSNEPHGLFYAKVKDGRADLAFSAAADVPHIWERHMTFADLPDGEWIFEIVDEGDRVAMILLEER